MIEINDEYRKIATALVDKFGELEDVNLDAVLFLEDDRTRKRARGEFVLCKTMLLPEIVRQGIACQFGRKVEFIIMVYKRNIEYLTRAQISVMIYRELARMGRTEDLDPVLRAYSISENANVLHALGPYWDRDNNFADLTIPGCNWGNVRSPGLFDQEEGKVVPFGKVQEQRGAGNG